jgi:glycosyltransferase involved in cell wall biosynthesis
VQSFDPHSDPLRKNPYGAIDAFHLAARDLGDKAHLVVKVNNVEVKGLGCDPDQVIQQLRARCDNDPRIHIIAQSLAYDEVLSLYASCDVFISLHRAEGLGLGLLESMTLGKPVIATAWSGNMSFMRHTNSCLVGYDLVPFSGMGADGRDKLGKYAVWAEPHIDEAADWIKMLVSDESLRLRIGKQAALDAAEYQAQATRGGFIDELRALVFEKEFIQRRNGDKWRQIDDVRAEFERYHFGIIKRAHKNAARIFDRLIGWRFR